MPKRPWILPTALLAALVAATLGLLAWGSVALPEQVASHFDRRGIADGWMERDAFLRFQAGYALAFPLLAPAILFCVRFLPDRAISLPRKEFWLAPERRACTFAWLFTWGIWFGVLSGVFSSALFAACIAANVVEPARLPVAFTGVAGSAFTVAVIVWIVALFRHFQSEPPLHSDGQ